MKDGMSFAFTNANQLMKSDERKNIRFIRHSVVRKTLFKWFSLLYSPHFDLPIKTLNIGLGGLPA